MRTRFAAALGVVLVAAVITAPALGCRAGKKRADRVREVPALVAHRSDGTGIRKLPTRKARKIQTQTGLHDGTRIAFDRCAQKCEIWVMKADGTGAKRLGPDCLNSRHDSCVDRALSRVVSRREADRVRPGPARERKDQVRRDLPDERQWDGCRSSHSRHSRVSVRGRRSTTGVVMNGKQLVFEVEHLAAADPPNRHALFIVNTDGTKLRQLTDWGFNAGDDPDWSPDGRLHPLSDDRAAQAAFPGNLYTIHPDGGTDAVDSIPGTQKRSPAAHSRPTANGSHFRDSPKGRTRPFTCA